jgi:hypothetical protein
MATETSTTIETLAKMLEGLPKPVHDQAIAHLREYLEDVTDEMRWNDSFERTHDELSKMAREARTDIEAGLAKDLDPDEF